MMTRHERYNRSPKGQARYARYRDSEKGRKNERVWELTRGCNARAKRILEIEEELTYSSLQAQDGG